MTAPEPEAPRYRLGPRSTRGLIAGWRTGQVACVAIGLVLAVGALRSVGATAGGLLALAAASGGIAVATWRLQGRTLEQWAPTAASFALRAVAEAGRARGQAAAGRPRGTLSRLALLELPEPVERGTPAPVDPTGLGVMRDAEASTLTAVVPVGGTGYALLSDTDRAERIAAWSGVLAALARDVAGLHRLQWLSTTYPAWLDGALPGGGAGLVGEHYARLLEEVSPGLWAHEVYVAVSVRSRGGGESCAALLRQQLSTLDERLRGAGLAPARPLPPPALAALVRRSFDVAPGSLPAACPWPVGIGDGWSRLRTEATWHATYWIAEWPRSEVGGGFLLPLLLEPGLRRVVSVTMAPVAVLTAVRRAQRERTEGTADAEMRRRHGFATTARAVREQESRQQREAELSEGHAGYRYAGYVRVTETDPAALERACGRLEQAAALSQLELRRLYGAQGEGWCCTLPLGRGCR